MGLGVRALASQSRHASGPQGDHGAGNGHKMGSVTASSLLTSSVRVPECVFSGIERSWVLVVSGLTLGQPAMLPLVNYRHPSTYWAAAWSPA